MSEHSSERSEWAAPVEAPVKSAREVLAETYGDGDNPEDMDKMVIYSDIKGGANQETIDTPEAETTPDTFVFVPRVTTHEDGTKTTRVEKWRLTGKFDEDTGMPLAESLVPEEKDGKIGIVEKGLSESTLNPDRQAELAEQMKKSQRETGHEALEVVGVIEPVPGDNSEINVETLPRAVVAEIISSGKERQEIVTAVEAETLSTGEVPDAELEVSAERTEVATDLGGQALDIIGVNEPNDEVDVETKPRLSIADMMSGEAEPKVATEVVAEAPQAEVAIETPEVPPFEAVAAPELSEQVVVEEAAGEKATKPEAVTTEPAPEAPAVESELGTAAEELEVFETKMGETKAALEELISGQYDSFKDINNGLDELFKDKTGQEADLPSLLRMNIAKLSTSIREIDSGQGDIDTLRGIVSILGSVRDATSHLQGSNSPLVTVQQLIESSGLKESVLGKGADDATQSMSQASGRISEAISRDESASAERERYDAIFNQSRRGITSIVSDITDKEGPIGIARQITTTMSSDLQAAQSHYYNMTNMIDNMINQVSRRPTDTRDLYAISSMIGQFENSFEQLERSKLALTGVIPQVPEQ